MFPLWTESPQVEPDDEPEHTLMTLLFSIGDFFLGHMIRKDPGFKHHHEFIQSEAIRTVSAPEREDAHFGEAVRSDGVAQVARLSHNIAYQLLSRKRFYPIIPLKYHV